MGKPRWGLPYAIRKCQEAPNGSVRCDVDRRLGRRIILRSRIVLVLRREKGAWAERGCSGEGDLRSCRPEAGTWDAIRFGSQGRRPRRDRRSIFARCGISVKLVSAKEAAPGVPPSRTDESGPGVPQPVFWQRNALGVTKVETLTAGQWTLFIEASEEPVGRRHIGDDRHDRNYGALGDANSAAHSPRWHVHFNPAGGMPRARMQSSTVWHSSLVRSPLTPRCDAVRFSASPDGGGGDGGRVGLEAQVAPAASTQPPRRLAGGRESTASALSHCQVSSTLRSVRPAGFVGALGVERTPREQIDLARVDTQPFQLVPNGAGAPLGKREVVLFGAP